MPPSSYTGKLPTMVLIGTKDAGSGMNCPGAGGEKKPGPRPSNCVRGLIPLIATGPLVPTTVAYAMVPWLMGAAPRNCAWEIGFDDRHDSGWIDEAREINL